MQVLNGRAILIVEDETLIALDLADTVVACGGIVVGPASTVVEAQQLLGTAHIDGAICDGMLTDRDCTPVALALCDRGIPMVVHSATGPPPALREAYPTLLVVMKPATADRVIGSLVKLLG